MTTHDLFVDELSATLAGVEPTPPARRWLDDTTAELVEVHLPRALAEATLPPGHWFIPRLELALRCRDVAALPPLAADWSRAIVEALARSVATDRSCVHFGNDVELVAAYLVAAVSTDPSADWVWARCGMDDATTRALPPAERVVAALVGRPHVAVAAMVRAAEVCSVAALDRALGEAGWQAVAVAAGAEAAVLEPPPSGYGEEPAEPDHTVEAMVTSATLGRLLLGSRLRPSAATAQAWAWLVVAEVEPAWLTTSRLSRTVGGVASVLLERLTEARLARAAALRDVPSAREETAARQAAHGLPGAAPRESTAESSPLDPDSPYGGTQAPVREAGRADPRLAVAVEEDGIREQSQGEDVPVVEEVADTAAAGISSQLAGLLHLLATATAAGLPDRVLDDPGLADRGVRWAVWQAALLLTAARPDDPAVLALAGLATDRTGALLDAAPATAAERRRLAVLAARWRRVTVARLCSFDPDVAGPLAGAAAVLGWLVTRPGQIDAEPGWITVVLPLSGVEPAIRAAGLDLDPGFVPWLGTVVRFHYE
ncbi:hypothetical protein [Nocardioides sp. zg-1230]|uniref:hypothetical protein n=1 Tax=Nocardioides sp. zg-1230 TaxID=2736601 RepID=UPI0015541EE0|nr:hypothetical protein [Nocardioides sp. zg-1230]NPC44593.1 hypothetical protein [Nocardioides sp. zg-1230]